MAIIHSSKNNIVLETCLLKSSVQPDKCGKHTLSIFLGQDQSNLKESVEFMEGNFVTAENEPNIVDDFVEPVMNILP